MSGQLKVGDRVTDGKREGTVTAVSSRTAGGEAVQLVQVMRDGTRFPLGGPASYWTRLA